MSAPVPSPTRVYRFQLVDEDGRRLCGLVSKTRAWPPGVTLSLSTGEVEVVRFVRALDDFEERHDDGYLVVRPVASTAAGEAAPAD